MKILKVPAAALLLSGALLISNNVFAQQVSKTVSVNNFNEITVSSGIDLYLTQAGTESAKIVGDKEIADKVLVEKDGNALRIKFKDRTDWSGFFRKQGQVKVYVNVKTLNALHASGGSDVYGQNSIKADRISLHTSGGSDVKINLVCKDITVESSGGSDLYLTGSADNMDLRSSGGSDVHAEKFSVNYAKVNSSGGSDANIHVNKALEANASGGSDIRFSGSAAYKKTSDSKSGSVRRID
jgi:hypothetical protein